MKKIALVLLLASFVACSLAWMRPSQVRTSVVPMADAPLGPLPREVLPQSYAIELEVDPAQGIFSGKARIALNLRQRTTSFWLHGHGLEVTKARLTAADGAQLGATYQEADEVGVAKVTLEKEAVAGNAQFEIEWRANLGERSEGLFHVEQEGLHYAFSQFEPLFARRMAPCFDEPSFKVPLELSVVIPRGQEAISNGATKELAAVDAARMRVRFEKTLPLPPYLWFLAVGPLDVVTGRDLPATLDRPRKLPLRVAGPRGTAPKLKNALARVAPIVEAAEHILGPFPYPKLDLIAVPSFAASAMENAGAIAYRDWLLLLDEERLGADQLRSFEIVTAHELAHQWFGDLVTMRWWDDLWLNEAFASWMQARVMDSINPDYKAGLESLAWTDSAMHGDSRMASRRIRQAISSHHDIDNAFDGITYTKGAAVLGMFERWVGRAKFDAGVRAYLAENAHGNARTADLLRALSAADGRDLDSAFSTFLDQPGVPFVDAKISCDNGQGRVKLSQRRWLPLGSKVPDSGLWSVPVCLRLSSDGKSREQCVLLETEARTVPLEGGCPDWVMPNADGAGYYRFNLDAASALALAQHREELTPREQLSFSQSLSSAFSAGALDAQTYFRAIEPLASSNDRLVARLPMQALKETQQRFLSDKADRVEAIAQRWFASQAASFQLGPKAGETSDEKLRRAELADFLLTVAREPKLRAAAKDLGRKFVGHGQTAQPGLVEPTLAASVLAVAVEEGGLSFVRTLADRLADANDADARRRILGALGHARGEAAQKARELILGKSVRGNEIGFILGGHMARSSEREAAWRWFQANFDALVQKAPAEFVGHMPGYAGDFCSEEEALEVERFFKPRVSGLSGAPRNLEITLETIRLCAARVEQHKAGAVRYFEGP